MLIILPRGSRKVILWKSAFKKSSRGQCGVLSPNLPKIFRFSAKNQFDNKAKFRYLNNHSFRLIKALVCHAEAEAGTPLAIFA
jgi:hypothetical protein